MDPFKVTAAELVPGVSLLTGRPVVPVGTVRNALAKERDRARENGGVKV